jgi:hypothetical protein
MKFLLIFPFCPNSRSRRFLYTNFGSNYSRVLVAGPQLNNPGTLLGSCFTTVLVSSARHLIVWLYGGLNSRVFVAIALRQANRSNTQVGKR